ncbi:TlpA family protein disulfide reductase [Paraburkholderia sp. LEh10]|uniref:TlpA family protein disulfide reductase n=1 Tax=Paraburkholderia sp. LEh10 TaxID=2821353 RepID=UPI001AE5A82B|nr:TlpA disulfide reductase family protein [Paraburkholderia sp. LEh10]MBP0590694.1 TlpA family protein disulfide reductase [Paraburkholderia sp. LEh10]
MKIGELVIPVAPLILVASVAISLMVGRLISRHAVDSEAPIVNIVLAALVVSRISFVARYLPAYREDWLSIFDFRDLGFDPMAGIVAGAAMLLFVFARRPRLRRALMFAAAAGVSSWLALTAAVGASTQVQTMPAVRLVDIDGNSRTLGGANGKPVVVNLWASWCAPCRSEMPMLTRAQHELRNIELDFVNQGESPEAVRDFLSAQKLAPDNVILDRTLAVAQSVHARGFPTTLFFDEHGRLLAVHLGPFSRATFQHEIESLYPSRAAVVRH